MEKTVKDVVKESFWIMPATPNFIDNGIPYITSKNIKMGKLDFSKVQYISQNDYDEISKNRPIIVNDLLISMIGTLGNVAIVKECDIPFYGQNMFLLRLNPDIVDLRYFYNYFNSDTINSYLQSKKNKSTQGYLKANHIDDLRIPIVSLEEQKRIADELDKITDLINKRKEQLIKLDELVKARFVELFGDPVLNQKGFPVYRMDEVVEFQGGSQPDKKYFEYEPTDDNIRLIQIRDYKTDKYITYIPRSMAKRFCTADDIMIGRYGPPIFQILQGIEGSFNVALMKATPKMGNREFVRQFLKQDCLLEYLEGLSKRTAGQDGIQMDKLKAYPFPMPPIELQDEFEQFIKQTDKSKLEVQKSLEKLELLKKALMQKYFG